MRALRILSVGVILLASVSTARGQCGAGGISLTIDPSIRSAGMGGATTANFLSADPNYWANPALLGYHRGIRYESSDTQLVPDFADDVFFKTDRWSLGGGGVGLAMNSWPGNQATTRLDYGESEAVDSDGNTVGTFNSYEDVKSWGIGVNLLEFVENLVGPRVGNWSRYGDVSLGYSRKHVLVDLAPASVLPGLAAAVAESDADDRGILVRTTPYNTIDYPTDTLPVALRVEAGWGRSVQNFTDRELVFAEAEQSDPIARDTRWGLFFAGAAGLSASAEQSLADAWPAWLVDWLVHSVSPLVEVGTSWDFSTYAVPNDGRHLDCAEESRWGLEMTLLQIFSYRWGSVDAKTFDVNGSSSGWSLGFHLADLGGFRFDRATIPQASGLSKVDREGFMAWVDLFAISRELRKL